MRNVKSYTQEEMDQIAALMSEALDSNEGLRALAAALAPPIEQAIATKEIASLLFTREDLPKGERAIYQKKPTVRAFWVSDGGEAREVGVGKEEIEIPTERIHSNPMVDKSMLKHGNIGTLMDIQAGASEEIRKEIDTKAMSVLSAAIPSENTVTVTGGSLTEAGLNQAISLMEDKELTVGKIIMRGRRFNDIRSWTTLDPQTVNELRTKGVIKNYGTAGILLTSACALAEVILLPDEEIGKMPVKEKVQVEPVDATTRFKTGWLVWEEIGFGVTRPDLCYKISITA